MTAAGEVVVVDGSRRGLGVLMGGGAAGQPLLMLSVASMMVGCYLLNDAMGSEAGNMGKTLLVLGVLNVYEFLLIGLGAMLVRSRPASRDGRILLGLESVFLVDATFLIANAVMTDVVWGTVITGALLVLAWVKLWWIAGALTKGSGRWLLGYVGALLAVLYAMPVALKLIEVAGEVPAWVMYVGWWAVGLLMAAYEVMRRVGGRRMEWGEGHVRVAGLFVVLPWVSLVAHLGFNHWVYRAGFFLADLSPVVLGLAMVLGRVRAKELFERDRLAFQAVLPGIAVLLGLGGSWQLTWVAWGSQVEAWVWSAAGAYLVYGYLYLLPYLGWMVLGAGVVGLGYVFGPAWGDVKSWANGAGAKAWEVIGWMVPRTKTGWGVLAMVGAFVLLGLGVWVGGARSPKPEVRGPNEGGGE